MIEPRSHITPTLEECRQCGHPLEVLGSPLRRLRWTRHWWRGLASFATQPLRVCTNCGTIYTYTGQLVAAGAAETDAEMRARGFKRDMMGLRDGFATVVIAGEVSVIWTLLSATPYDIGVTIIAGTVGGLALIPFAYFARKTAGAKRVLKKLKTARLKGEIKA